MDQHILGDHLLCQALGGLDVEVSQLLRDRVQKLPMDLVGLMGRPINQVIKGVGIHRVVNGRSINGEMAHHQYGREMLLLCTSLRDTVVQACTAIQVHRQDLVKDDRGVHQI